MDLIPLEDVQAFGDPVDIFADICEGLAASAAAPGNDINEQTGIGLDDGVDAQQAEAEVAQVEDQAAELVDTIVATFAFGAAVASSSSSAAGSREPPCCSPNHRGTVRTATKQLCGRARGTPAACCHFLQV